MPQHGTILVVEDEFFIRWEVTEHLSGAGFDVLEASNGFEARRILESDEAVTVVVTDIRMPGEFAGWELVRWVAENKPHVPVIVASATAPSAEPDDISTVRAFVSKPYRPPDIERHIRAVLRQET